MYRVRILLFFLVEASVRIHVYVQQRSKGKREGEKKGKNGREEKRRQDGE